MTDVAVTPFIPKQVARRVAGLEFLDIDIVDIDKGVSYAKGDMAVVGKVWECRHARNRKPDGIERVAGEVELRIQARHLEGAVWIAGQQWPATRGPRRPNRPIVAATIGGLRPASVASASIAGARSLARQSIACLPRPAGWLEYPGRHRRNAAWRCGPVDLRMAAARHSLNQTEPIR